MASSTTLSADVASKQQQSPRNTGGQSIVNPTAVKLGSIDVPKALQDGEKFLKWDEETCNGIPVTVRVDPKGFYLYWVDQNHEMDLLDIATIRDVRTGRYARKPRDMKLRQLVTMGSQDTLEEKTVTVCYGVDFVNVNFINFCCTRKEIAKLWCDELIRMAYNLTQLNGPAIMFLQKAYTKLCLQVDKSGKIPVKNIIKTFATNKDDRRRVEKALDVSGLPSGKVDSLALSKFQFEDFFNLYKNLTQRSEVEKVYDELVGTSKRRLMSTTQLVDFLNKTQRDPRLNEILHPYANTARARDLIQEYEPNKFNAQKGQLSIDGFLRYLMSEDNPIMAVSKLDLSDDMEQPLSHYFINSSHNTYLTGHQLTGKSSVEIYRQSLLAGCRCVELDFWNGRTEEPVIVHGYTFVPEINAKDVLEAIAETAFKTSEFPVILSFENHCNPRQQAKIANYCRDIFGDMLLDRPLDSHPLEPGMHLPSPGSLKRKIIIKNKKKHHHHHHHHKKGGGGSAAGGGGTGATVGPGAAGTGAGGTSGPGSNISNTANANNSNVSNNVNANSTSATAMATAAASLFTTGTGNSVAAVAVAGTNHSFEAGASLQLQSQSQNQTVVPDENSATGITQITNNNNVINNGNSQNNSNNNNGSCNVVITTTTNNNISNANAADDDSATPVISTTTETINSNSSTATNCSISATNGTASATPNVTGNGDVMHHAPPLQQIRQSSKESTGSSDTDSSSDDESMPGAQVGPIGSTEADKVQQTKETEAGAEISALVNYVQPVHFNSFEASEKKARYYEMSSFDEKQATTLLKERPIEFVNYNKHQLSRVYPAGTRFDSSNFMPQLFWNAGCQLVALNYQTLDLAMQLNLGLFEYNHRCGYILKPEFMRRTDRRLDPFAESTVDGIIAGTVIVTVLSGQFLTDKKVGTYVEVDMFGLPADTVRKKFRTKIVRDNGINPIYGEDPFVFKKVVLPELASIRISAYEEGGKPIGHRVLPVIGLCPGFRHLTLRTEVGQPIPLATLFLSIVVKDYVPDGLSELAEALANPIKYQSELEKRSEQLAVLQEDMEPDEDESCTRKDTLKASDNVTSSPKHRVSAMAAASASVDSDHDVRETPLEAISKVVALPVAQSSIDQTSPLLVKQATIPQQSHPPQQEKSHSTEQTEIKKIIADPLEKIFEDKQVRKKREALEKELKTLKKNHDKEKIKVTAHKSGDLSDGIKKSKFGMGNKLVKRFSSKNMADMNLRIPPCAVDGDSSDNSAQAERLKQLCRDHASSYREVLEKYHEIIYNLAEDLLRQSQEAQMKQMKVQLERETSEVMRQLQLSRKNEVKQLAQVHKDKDELERMKREVDSTLVEKGVAERVRLTATFERKRDDLQRQHDQVKHGLEEHRAKAKAMLEKEAESHACISDTFLAHLNTSTSTTSCSSVGGSGSVPQTSVSSGDLCGQSASGPTGSAITKSNSSSNAGPPHENNVNNTHV
ncbi:1-phosphatidylinositol 4,5-bisphosphate phosphodiesterase classes I and II isoform X2 [Uranotaenia lowii]|uniref:1-phosphatidylinositol 4,5-bisphosphate phosphodiesterase classes I and II isoform X2 n=1 Tax=Uranotaenia lowii TaxID=190385 RepID=UPI002478F94F|nr:1-phosphatidylinositol 4,5-bisphosphate phosphodiesterase classes I and II isoform X2 [Uranotaenia lowii]